MDFPPCRRGGESYTSPDRYVVQPRAGWFPCCKGGIGFKAGAGENAAPGAATGFVSIIVDPEEMENHELGIKSTWLDNRIAVNLAA